MAYDVIIQSLFLFYGYSGRVYLFCVFPLHICVVFVPALEVFTVTFKSWCFCVFLNAFISLFTSSPVVFVFFFFFSLLFFLFLFFRFSSENRPPTVGMIAKVRHQQTGIYYAMKTIQLSKFSPIILREMRNEIEILKRLDHPNTIREFQAREYLLQSLWERVTRKAS